MIDPDQFITGENYPLALREALVHRRNTMVGNIEVEGGGEYHCGCCNRRMRKSQRVGFEVGDIGFLGAGYTLYFMFKRMCLIVMIVILGFVKANPYVYEYLRDRYSVQYIVKQYQLLNLQVILSIFTIVYWYEKRMTQTVIQLDETHVDPQDYSVRVKNLPIQFSQDNKLDTALKTYFSQQYSQKITIASICLCYNLVPLGRFLSRKKEQVNMIKKYRAEKEKRMKVVNVLFGVGQLPYEGISSYHGVKREDSSNVEMANFEEYSKEKLASIDQFINFSYHNSNIMFIGEAILSFETVEMKTIVLNESKSVFFFGNKLKIEQITNPKDIIWHNLHLQSSDRKLRRIFSYVSCVALIFMTLSIRIFFAWIQLKTEGTKFQSSLLKSSTSGIIILMNMAIQNFFLKHLSQYEGHQTKSKNLTMFATKCIALQILTCLIVPYLAAYFIFQMKQQQTYLQKIDDLIFGNALVSLFLLSISHKTLIKKLKIKLYEFGGWRFIPKKVLTVRQLCSMYQLPEFEIEKRYSQTVKNSFLTICFYTMVPKALLYTIIHLFFVYYLDKYNLVRRRCVMVSLNGNINKTMIMILLLAIPLHIIAEMINQKEISKVMIILLLFSVMSLIKFLTKKRCEKKVDIASSMNFWEANCKYFHTDYRRQNPALIGVAQGQFEAKVKQFNLEMNLSQEEITRNMSGPLT